MIDETTLRATIRMLAAVPPPPNANLRHGPRLAISAEVWNQHHRVLTEELALLERRLNTVCMARTPFLCGDAVYLDWFDTNLDRLNENGEPDWPRNPAACATEFRSIDRL